MSTQYDETTGLTTGDGVLGMGSAATFITADALPSSYPRVQFVKGPQYNHPLERDCEYLLENGWEADTSNGKGNGNWIPPGDRRVVGSVFVCSLSEAIAIQAQWSACDRFDKVHRQARRPHDYAHCSQDEAAFLILRGWVYDSGGEHWYKPDSPSIWHHPPQALIAQIKRQEHGA